MLFNTKLSLCNYSSVLWILSYQFFSGPLLSFVENKCSSSNIKESVYVSIDHTAFKKSGSMDQTVLTDRFSTNFRVLNLASYHPYD